MTAERKLELILLRWYLKDFENEVRYDSTIDRFLITDSTGCTYDAGKMFERQDELASEFLSQYVVYKPSKEE